MAGWEQFSKNRFRNVDIYEHNLIAENDMGETTILTVIEGKCGPEIYTVGKLGELINSLTELKEMIELSEVEP